MPRPSSKESGGREAVAGFFSRTCSVSIKSNNLLNYARGVAVGNNQMPASYDAPPPVKSLAITGNTNQAASSVITLTQNTTAIEVAALGAGGAMLRWIAIADTEASVVGVSSVGATYAPNFDHAIPAATVRRFVVPVESFVATGYASTQGVNRLEGLFRRVAVIAGGASSVVVTEYGSSNSY